MDSFDAFLVQPDDTVKDRVLEHEVVDFAAVEYLRSSVGFASSVETFIRPHPKDVLSRQPAEVFVDARDEMAWSELTCPARASSDLPARSFQTSS